VRKSTLGKELEYTRRGSEGDDEMIKSQLRRVFGVVSYNSKTLVCKGPQMIAI
jgi:hypothetical protein